MDETVLAMDVKQQTETRDAAVELSGVIKRLQRHVGSKIMRELQSELTQLDLTFSQITALHQLRAKEVLSVTQLSERTYLSLPAASHLVDKLVKRDLVQREENPDNRREKVVRLTKAGQNVLAQMDEGFVQGYIQTFSGLDPQILRATTAQIDQLLTALGAEQEQETL